MPAHSGLGLLSVTLTPQQATLVESPLGEPQSLFLAGPAGSGKTTAGVARLLRLLHASVPADSMLVLVPQRTLGRIYQEALRAPEAPAGAQVDVLTIGGLAQRSVELYWPLVAGPAGFAHPDRPPVYLTLETAQYYMDRLIEPYLEQGAFGEVTLSRQRLISQILDDLNKAAVAGFPYLEIGARLSRAWAGESSRLRVYDQVQACASDFRRFCLLHNLLDFSLQVEVFVRQVLALPEAAGALQARYRHLLVDNAEEDVPVAHDLVAGWLAECESAWVIYDEDGGLRSYLGADPASALALGERCAAQARLAEPLGGSPALRALVAGLARTLGFGAELCSEREGGEVRSERFSASPGAEAPTTSLSADVCSERFSASPGAEAPTTSLGAEVRSERSGAEAPSTSLSGEVRSERFSAPLSDPRPCLILLHESLYTDALHTVAGQVSALVQEQGVPPGEIALLAPFMTDALRFALAQALGRRGIPSYSRRPSRALADEPAARCLLTLAKLAHPAWGLVPPRTDVAHALLAAVDGMDLVRAWHLTAIAYRPGGTRDAQGAGTALVPFEQIRAQEQLRITYLLGNRYEALRTWLVDYAAGPALPLDHFFGRLFDEVLSAPGYVFRHDRDSAAVTAHLMDSARRFRQTVGEEEPFTSGSFATMVERGVVAAQYLPATLEAPDAVLLAPAFTFAMGNRPVEVQFWLNLSSPTWARRLYQPLTHPYVLTRRWPEGAAWTDGHEDEANRRTLYRLALALIRRCRRLIYLADSTYSERGFEEHGMLQQAIFRTLRRVAREEQLRPDSSAQAGQVWSQGGRDV
jgi:hypothetical protein